MLEEKKRVAKSKYKLWVQSGKVLFGNVYDDMLQAKKAYKNEIRKAKKLKKDKRGAYVESLLECNDSKFWKKWKRITCVNKSRVNDVKLGNDLLHSFENKYVNSIDNVLLFEEFLSKYENLMENSTCDDINNVNVLDVEYIEKCARELLVNRACDGNELTVEHIINAHPIIYCHLKNLFHLIIQHGHVPKEFKLGVIVPVIKDSKKDLSCVDNYRPVTIISVISKLFEMCIYKRINSQLKVKGMQFGFVRDGGCDKSIFAVQNTVNHFVKRKSNVFMVTLDASAAFDRINVYGLLSKLIDKGVPCGFVSLT